MTPTPLQHALRLPPGPQLAQELLDLGAYPVKETAEAETVCAKLATLDDLPPCGVSVPRDDGEVPTTVLYMLASLLQRVESAEVYAVFESNGVPALLEAYDRRLTGSERNDEDLLFLLKVFAMYPGAEGGLARIVDAARAGLASDDTLWQTVFSLFNPSHPQARELIEALRDPLPAGFVAVALLDCANALALSGAELSHPFGSEAGQARLEAYLSDRDPSAHSFAHSAAAALPFVSRPGRDRLLALALDHPNDRVQLEGAWASCRVGSKAGVKLLQRACLDPRRATIARNYLIELELRDEIPAEALEPDLLALAEMCHWLSHPHEFGEVPQTLRVFDTRTMHWPPANEERQVWLIEYGYPPEAEGEPERTGVGMVGSITFALYGEGTTERSPEDLYALHCCWELQIERDPRAPKERSVEAGRAILGL